MAVSNTPRFTLPQWGAGTDLHPGRTGWNNVLLLLEDQAAIVYPSGTVGNRPRGGTFGRFYLATDQGDGGRLYYDGGSGWIELNTNGGGGPGRPLAIGGSAWEGTSNRSARADHTHALALATPTNHGALSSQDKALLDSASVTASGSSLVQRTSSGNVVVPTTPGGSNDAASKSYVDSKSGGSTINATHLAQANTIMQRTSSGTTHVNTGTHSSDATNKAYVDGKTWHANDIVAGHLSVHRIFGSMHAAATAWNGSGTIKSVHVTSGGEFCFYSSTGLHKTNVTDYARTVEDLLGPVPVEFDRLDPKTGEPTGVHDHGFIAEKAGKYIPELVQWGTDEDGKPRVDGWDYPGMVTGHQKLHRWAADRIASLEQTVNEKDDEIGELKDRLSRIEEHLGL